MREVLPVPLYVFMTWRLDSGTALFCTRLEVLTAVLNDCRAILIQCRFGEVNISDASEEFSAFFRAMLTQTILTHCYSHENAQWIWSAAEIVRFLNLYNYNNFQAYMYPGKFFQYMCSPLRALLDVTFSTFVALLQPISILRSLNSAFCCTVHILPDTDSHWEVKLASFAKSDGRPCAQVVPISQPTKASQHRLLPTINWAYPKLTFFRLILKLESFWYV
jgi:hypothetical protein